MIRKQKKLSVCQVFDKLQFETANAFSFSSLVQNKMFATKVIFLLIIAGQLFKIFCIIPICNEQTTSLSLESGISVLPESVFDNCNNLIDINLNNNKISMLPGKVFFFNRKIERLFFSNNNIKEIPVNVFDNLPNLWFLDLSYNNITFFYFQSLMNTKIKHLNLAHNNIANIDTTTICYMPHLR